MPSFGSFGELTGWHESHRRDQDLAKAIQLTDFGNGLDSVTILNRHDLTRESTAKKRAFARCYVRGAKEELACERWAQAKQNLTTALNLGLTSWTVHRRVDLLAQILSGKTEARPPNAWFERYRCPCEICAATNASLLESARCRGIVNEPCVPVYQSNVDGVYAVGVYRWAGDEDSLNALSRMIRWLKKNEGEEICKYLGWLLVSGFRDENADVLKEADILVRVPADPERTSERGFDNIAELGQWIERFAIIPLAESLHKTVATADLRHVPWS